MAENKGVLIVGELSDGKLASITAELLGIGRKLADDLDEGLSAVFIGNGITDVAGEAITLGADKVYVIDDPLFKDYVTDSYVGALEKLSNDQAPEILLLGQTSMGRDLAPRLAFRLGTAVTLDCVDLVLDPDTKLLQKSKPVYGGNAMAVYVSEEGRPQMATIRPKAMEPLEQDVSRKGEVIPFDPALDESAVRARVVEKVKEEVVGIKLEDADVVICGGRGIGSAEAFEQLKELAKILNGAVGATRPPCDSGWVPAHLQVGLTGKLVSPTLYIGIALSGSSQHQAGMSGSKNIVAINKDPEANIFGIAHYGVVGDYKKLLPAFLEKCKELLSG
ncbi:electron transfer flavoprotein subunit alpha/FixB family protein [Dehalococcoidia bacterium]|nr:electron transfer flavoprotein subunit alpha/FixB family protein [Dehalococcoidia bacterium]MCL0048306.1 electron transfer flavoprotein subunit alpha/FixB family protein [Dehalococcoidia bacterium]MCL0050654.1 electron transfer flavoprotein subunit alpha/FixB family protein [Dehalococcoidia bacterium]MCL0059787.1 electron transfer flavoprotein subunit alpha/FixB family protein [Dehalococcoidia bacterium]MCL0065096.1 electron transfer flavoprotein subunit alpha/FixB family protein [Dehalococc